jgi:site-specific recombinase XerD
MASVVRDPGGRKRILFMDAGGFRRTLRLGKAEVRDAEGVRVRIERLVSAEVTRQPLDAATAQWVMDLDDVLHARMVAVGLLKPRHGRALWAWLEGFMDSREGLKPESQRKLAQTCEKLVEHFGEDKQIHDITPEEGSRWREWLKSSGLSEATTRTHVGSAKTIFREAVRRELLARSPFEHLKGGVTPTSNDRYVTPEETEKLLAAAPDTEWALLLGLARLAGLRTPSETHLVTIADVDWKAGRLRVRSPKTERFAGHEQRVVPVCPRLMQLLQARYDELPDGQTHFVTIKGAGGRRRKMVAIMDKAGVRRWDDAWQTLRRSCEIEWAQLYPQYAVSRWIGHSITVSGRHYANAIPDELFARAAGTQAAQIAAQHAAETGRTEQQTANS